MERDVSLVAKLRDEVSTNANRMGDSVKRFSRDAEETDRVLQALGKRQDEISRQMAKTQTALDGASTGLKNAKKAYAELNDEASEKALEEAHGRVNQLTDDLKNYKQAAGDTQKAMRELNEQQRKANNLDGGSSMGGSSMLGQLAKAGLTKMAGDTLSGVANTFVGSAFGSDAGTMFSSTLSGAAAGAALGSVVPVLGTAVGAAIGGILGAVNGGTQVFEKKDDAFKSYVQENTQAQLSARDSDIQSGSATAGQREQDAIAFNRLLGAGKGDKYLSDLRAMANNTPMEYGDLTTMSRSLSTGFKDDPERMLTLIRDIGDAGSALGVDTSGMNTMATAMSRMQASGKVTLEYLNLIQERGVDAVGMLADGLGKTKGEVYDLISKGKLDGVEAVQVIQDKMSEMYGGAMEQQAKTFAGRSSTLADAETEMRNAYGEGYNETRGEGIKEQTDWLSGASGEAQQEANKAIGAWQASLENAKEKYIREAVDGAMETDDYKKAKAEGDAAEMGRIIMAAKVKGQGEYNANEGKDEALKSELELAATIRGDAQSNEAYYDAGLIKGQEYSRGLGDGMMTAIDTFLNTPIDELISGPKSAGFTWRDRDDGGTFGTGGSGGFGGGRSGKPTAWGLNRVPYDNFPALLHEGERVLTAREARQQDGGGGGAPTLQIEIHDNQFSGTAPEQARQIAQLIVGEIVKAKVVQAPK